MPVRRATLPGPVDSLRDRSPTRRPGLKPLGMSDFFKTDGSPSAEFGSSHHPEDFVLRRVNLIAGCAAFITLPFVSASAQTAPIDHAAWIAGCWEQRSANRLTMEMWMPPAGGTMMGASRTTAGGATREYEQLHTAGDTLIYSALPSGQRPTDFRSTSLSSTALVFENPAHDFPRKITYRRVGADSLIARVEGPGPNNTTRGFDIRMRRASCTASSAAPH
jgi:hypothetical protein